MTPDQSEFMALAEEGVKAAKVLLEAGHPGFAASRAYYAMFTAAEAALLSKELSFSKHSAVLSGFGQHFAKPGTLPAELHQYMLAAQKDRQAADYGGTKQVTHQRAAMHIRNAEDFVSLVRSFLEAREGQ